MNDADNAASQEQTCLARHLTLVVGVSLPLLLVLVFWVAMIVPRMTVSPPQYDLVLSTRYYYDDGHNLNGTLDFAVRDGQLLATFREDPSYSRPRGNMPAIAIPLPRLYYFASATGSLREIDFALPETLVDGAVVPIDAFDGRRLYGESMAPDGYRFDNSYRGSRGFLFLFDGYRYSAKIEKDGRAVKIPSLDQNNYVGNVDFIGWTDPAER